MTTRIPTPSHTSQNPLTRPNFIPWLSATLLLLTAISGCTGKKPPEPIPPQTTTQVSPQIEPPPQLPPPVREVRPSRSSTVTVIDPGVDDDKVDPKTLLEASQLAKALEAQGQSEAVVQINDENLHQYAEQGDIIMLEGEPAAPALERKAAAATVEKGSDGGTRDEPYWRNRAVELRMGWRRTADRIADLELEAAALRQEFYAEEDPYLRDSQIKPEWDSVLDEIRRLEERTDRYQRDLGVFLEEGRRADVPPGWLSEGWELEPEPIEAENVEEFTIHKSTDIPVADEVEDP